jgi:hypothetical protein
MQQSVLEGHLPIGSAEREDRSEIHSHVLMEKAVIGLQHASHCSDAKGLTLMGWEWRRMLSVVQCNCYELFQCSIDRPLSTYSFFKNQAADEVHRDLHIILSRRSRGICDFKRLWHALRRLPSLLSAPLASCENLHLGTFPD